VRGSWGVALRFDHDVRVGGGVAEPALDKYAHRRHTELGSTRRAAAGHVKLTGGGLHRIDIGALAATALFAAHDEEGSSEVPYATKMELLKSFAKVSDFDKFGT
jgi:hypothetical protein